VILAANSCRYKIPVTYPDTLSIGSRICGIGPDSFLMEYAAYSQKLGKVVTEGDALVVLYNYVEKRRGRMSPELKAAIVALEGHEPPPLPPRTRRTRSSE
jgi:acyl-CoA thioester hydrolase